MVCDYPFDVFTPDEETNVFRTDKGQQWDLDFNNPILDFGSVIHKNQSIEVPFMSFLCLCGGS